MSNETMKGGERAAFEAWVAGCWRPDDGAKLLRRDYPRMTLAAWKARAASHATVKIDEHAALLLRIATEMRSEHDNGDGHFSTEEVEFIEQMARSASQATVKGDDLVLVPRELLGSACHAIAKKLDAPATLAKLREIAILGCAAAPQAGALTDEQRGVIGLLIDLARVTHRALDDSEEGTGDDGRFHAVDGVNFDAVSDVFDKLEELPDDKPGYTLDAAGKAEWALRDVLAAAQGGNRG